MLIGNFKNNNSLEYMPTKKNTGNYWGGCATCGGSMTGGCWSCGGASMKGGCATCGGKKAKKQRGGAASDWVGSFYANTAVGGPAAISRATLEGIADAPMFNPLSGTATFPTNSTGIIPTGTYLAFASPTVAQVGGARRKPRSKSTSTRAPKPLRTVRRRLF